MITIVGLGNPGNEFEETRHNVGFMVIDALCESLETSLEAGKGDYLIGTSRYKGNDVRIVKPLTYMNNSGLAVADIVDRYHLKLDELLVVCDDLNLPLGRIRLRPQGSDGGHNGLYSIIYQLQTEEFPRLRCGIGKLEPTRNDFNGTQFVLSNFERSEKPMVTRMIRDVHHACLSFVTEGLTSAMDRWNPTSKNSNSPTGIALEQTFESETEH